MEKDPQPESLQTVTIKADYPPSEVYSSEPPPAYHKPKSAAVQVARIIAFTVVAVSIILGGFMLASAYVQANGYRQHELELQLLSETADRLQPEALVQADSQQQQAQAEPLISEESKTSNDLQDNSLQQDAQENNVSDNGNNSNESTNNESSESEENNIQFDNGGAKIPLQIDIDDLMSTLMEKNQKSKLNCIVDKKRADEIIDHQPKMAQLPFGINIRTDPRFERISGERIAIICESGNVQKISPPEEQEDTIMIQPVMIPIPPQHFQTHMAQVMPQEVQIQTQQVPNIQHPPYQQFRGSMIPSRVFPGGENRPQFFTQHLTNNFGPQSSPQSPPQLPPQYPSAPQAQHFAHDMREGMMVQKPQHFANDVREGMMVQKPQHFLNEMREGMMVQKSQQGPTENRPVFIQEEMRVGLIPPRPQPQVIPNSEQRPLFFQEEMRGNMETVRPETTEPVAEVTENIVEERPDSQAPISPLVHHIIRQIMRQRLQAEKQSEMAREGNNVPSQFEVPPAVDRLPIPLEILRQINRLPGNRGVIVAVSQHEPEEANGEVQIIRQEPRDNAQEMNGKQFQEPVIPMVQEQQQQQQQQEESAEETRPHFVQPRSVQ